MPQTRIQKVIAGPGAGKTTGLVKEVLKELDSIQPNRFLTVITYTNASTEKIHKELEKHVRIPKNLFIGTIHSFLDRFILIPHASTLGIVPQDLTFIDDLHVTDSKYKNAATKKARDKGVITYAQIEWISEKIVSGGKIKVNATEISISKIVALNHARLISKRIQSIFVDEYQDATMSQHNIFTKLIATGMINHFYCVGDPEQYIYGFTYMSKSKKPAFKEIPIHQMSTLKNIQSKELTTNKRSKSKIVKFINNFSTLKQEIPYTSGIDEDCVFFLKSQTETKIIELFTLLCAQYNLTNKTKFYLSYAASTIRSVGLTEGGQNSNTALTSEKLLSETLRFICSISGYSQKEIKLIKGLNDIELRKIAIKILKKIKQIDTISVDMIKSILHDDFAITCKTDRDYQKDHDRSLDRIIVSLHSSSGNKNDIKSTIHKSKGLEAYGVLVIAKTKKELLKWLEVNQQQRSNDEEDVCRIGFVAFSRARELLCIACLEDVSDMYEQITNLGISSYTTP